MPLSRLENFLKNVEGNIIYVNPTDLDATDSIENQGNSLTRPFKTIQRALLESARFSYQIGQDNDKFDRTTVLLYPGEHEIDNRPGYNVVVDPGNAAAAQFRDRLGNVKTDLTELNDESNYNLDDPDNVLYKYNSVEGGVIVPRGVSIAGYDVRKTKIRPKFVPDPENLAVTRSAVFRLTGGCHFWAVSFFDANPKTSCYKDYTDNRYLPQFSHHKLTVFEYADGVNGVGIGTSTVTTDLQMYFNKVQKAFGDSSGRPIADFPVNTDMQPKLPEYEITGPVNTNEIGISSIRAGTGANPSATITVRTGDTPHGLVVDSAIRIAGVSTYPNIYNGNFTVTGVGNSTEFTYEASSVPPVGLPSISNTEVILPDTDNVTGSSPYIFHCSLRSAYGMCGLHADGSKSAGFKSMLVAQFTGIGLQKDNNAFLVYNKTTGQYDTNATASVSEKPLYLNGQSLYRPSYKNAHIKTSNNAFVQAVSVFAVGFAEHFTTASGGDMSITNSNSNFGAVALNAKGFKGEAFNKDNRGYITHIIPPRSQFQKQVSQEWEAIDVDKTTASTVNQEQIHLDGFTDPAIPPVHVISGYRIGARAYVDGTARTNTDLLYVSVLNAGTFSAEIVMQNKSGGSGDIGIKQYRVQRTGVINSITDSKITLDNNHQLNPGESIRIISDDGHLPDGLDTNVIYYAVTSQSTNESSLGSAQIRLARSKNDALLGGSGNVITINNNKGGVLTVESRVSDKKPGDLGHPIQYDSTKSNWYIQVKGTSNEIFTAVNANKTGLGPRTGKTFIKRKEDTRSLNDKIYRLRYVIPKESSDARPPIPGYTLQESSTVGVSTSGEFTNAIPDVTVQRNLRTVKSVDRDPNTGITTVVTEKPHSLILGDEVQFRKIQSSGNTAGTVKIGYNITRDIVGITSSKGFEVKFYDTDPGTYVDTSVDRSDNLPTVSRRTFKDTFTVYRSEIIKAHDYQRQDGVYHLICIDSSISPTVNEYTTARYNQNITDLYPQYDGDNFEMDPVHASSFALNTPMGKVVTNDLRKSISKEFTNNFIVGSRIGYAVTGAASHINGITTVWTNVEHGFNKITAFATPSAGSGYGSAGTIYNVHLTGGSGHGATANITINGSGQVTAIELVDGGSGYTKGNTLTLHAGNKDSTVVVNKVHDNIGDAIQVVGVGSIGNRYTSGFSGIHTAIAVTPKSVTYQLDSGISAGIHSYTTAGIHTGFFMLAGNAPRINSISYSNVDTGIVVVTTDEPHGLSVNNSIKIVGAAQTIYNGEHLVYEKSSTTQFSFKLSEKFTPANYTTTAGKAQVLPIYYGAKGGEIAVGDEKLAERQIPLSVGVSTTLSASAWTNVNTTLTLTDSSGFYKGDYVQIDEEIVRISTDFSSNAATVLRGQLGSRAEAHLASSLVKKIRVMAVEKRRASVLRASGHTFEYLGFGPGNYSTSFPEKQEKILTREENFLAQSTIDNGGSVVYTGVNDAGDFHIGNKVVNSQDGTEATFNIPIPTSTGSGSEGDSASGRLDVIFDTVTVREGVIIDGNNNTTVKINAPTTVTKKFTSSSDDGAEFVSIDLTGGLSPSRTLTYVDAAPTGSSTIGDILFKANPNFGDHLGWTYTPNGWKPFGLIGVGDIGDSDYTLTALGIGSTGPGLDIQAGQTPGARPTAGVPPKDASGAGGGVLDVRGQIVGDYLLMTGISTFLGTTIFQDVTIDRLSVTGSLDVTGITTFHVPASGASPGDGAVIAGAGLTAHGLSVVGFSTFWGEGARHIMQYKAPTTTAHTNVNHAASPATITITGHGYSTNEKVRYIAGTTAIGGLTNRSIYFVINNGANSISLKSTRTGSAIDLTSTGAGTHKFESVEGSFDSTAATKVASATGLQVDQLNVVGVCTFPNTVTFTNINTSQITANSDADFQGVKINGLLEVDGTTQLDGAFNANGEVNLGNATSDNITAIGRFDSDLVPSTNGQRDLGTTDLQWKSLYIDEIANIDDLRADTAKISDLSANRVVYSSAADGELSDSGNLTFNGSTLGLTGTLSHTGDATHVGDVNFDGATAGRDAIWDRSEDCFRLQDNAQLRFGTNSDTRLYHNNVDFYIDNQKGHIFIQNGSTNDDSNIYIRARDGENSIGCFDDSSVNLYHDNAKRLVTTSTGITVYEGATSSETPTGVITGSGSGLIELNASNISSGTIGAQFLPSSIGGNSASSSTVLISQSSSSSNHQVLFVGVDASGNHTPLIDNGNGDFLYNPNASKLSGLAEVEATLFRGNLNGSTVTTSSTATIAGQLKPNGGIYVNTDKFTVESSNGNTSIAGTLGVTGTTTLSGNATVGGTLTVTGNSTFNGDVTLGNSATGDDVNITGRVATNFNPTTNGSKNMGTSSLRWGEIHGASFHGNGASLTALNASQLTTGIVDVSRLGSTSGGGARNSDHYLRGDNQWAEVPAGINVTNQGANRVMTCASTANTLDSEDHLTFDNTSLHVHGSSRQIVCDGNIVAYNVSDITFKDNVQPITNAVEKVLSISGNTFTWNDKAPKALVEFTGVNDTGVIAQEVEKLELPGTVQTKDDGTLGVRYEKLVPLLIEAIKELKGEIDELKSQIK